MQEEPCPWHVEKACHVLNCDDDGCGFAGHGGRKYIHYVRMVTGEE